MANSRRKWGGYICNDLINTTGDAIQQALAELQSLSERTSQEETLRRLFKVITLLSRAGVAIFTLRDMFRENHTTKGDE